MAISALMYGLTVDGYVSDADNGDVIDGATVRFIYLEGICQGGGGYGNQGGGHGINVVSTTTDQITAYSS
ncbi:MAG: hypothetical protein P9M11_05245 [Candidatus Tenebribacter burtonii]|nr:hypothetical protein [Candidatus Tenebribacter burtonii]